MPKKVKPALPVVEQAQNEPPENAPVPSEAPKIDLASTKTSPVIVPVPLSILDFAKNLPDDKIQLAEQFGIPIKGLIQYLYQQEQLLNEVVHAIPELPTAVVNKLQSLAQQQTPTAANPSGIMGNVGQFLPVIMQALGAGGGGSSPITDDLVKKVVEAGIDQMFAGTRLLKAMETKILTEFGVKTVTDMTK